MQVKYIVKMNGVAYYYSTMEEAVKIARWAGIAVSEIKEAHVY